MGDICVSVLPFFIAFAFVMNRAARKASQSPLANAVAKQAINKWLK